MMTQHEERLLFVAKNAAQKLRTMYVRGEVSPRYELGDLIKALPHIKEAIRKNRQGKEVMAQVDAGTIEPIDQDVDFKPSEPTEPPAGPWESKMTVVTPKPPLEICSICGVDVVETMKLPDTKDGVEIPCCRWCA